MKLGIFSITAGILALFLVIAYMMSNSYNNSVLKFYNDGKDLYCEVKDAEGKSTYITVNYNTHRLNDSAILVDIKTNKELMSVGKCSTSMQK